MKEKLLVAIPLRVFICLFTLIGATLLTPTLRSQVSCCQGGAPCDCKMQGTVKADGDQITFVSDKQKKTWKIENPEVLKGHEGHHVQVKAHVYADKDSIHVKGVKMLAAKSETKKDEMK